MKNRIRKSIGRWVIWISTIGSGLLSIIILLYVGRGGRIHNDMINFGIVKILEIYLPIIAIMTAFYFVGSRNGKANTSQYVSIEVFTFSVVISSLWIFLPPLMITFIIPIEHSFNLLQQFEKYGQTAAIAA